MKTNNTNIEKKTSHSSMVHHSNEFDLPQQLPTNTQITTSPFTELSMNNMDIDPTISHGHIEKRRKFNTKKVIRKRRSSNQRQMLSEPQYESHQQQGQQYKHQFKTASTMSPMQMSPIIESETEHEENFLLPPTIQRSNLKHDSKAYPIDHMEITDEVEKENKTKLQLGTFTTALQIKDHRKKQRSSIPQTENQANEYNYSDEYFEKYDRNQVLLLQQNEIEQNQQIESVERILQEEKEKRDRMQLLHYELSQNMAFYIQECLRN